MIMSPQILEHDFLEKHFISDFCAASNRNKLVSPPFPFGCVPYLSVCQPLFLHLHFMIYSVEMHVASLTNFGCRFHFRAFNRQLAPSSVFSRTD